MLLINGEDFKFDFVCNFILLSLIYWIYTNPITLNQPNLNAVKILSCHIGSYLQSLTRSLTGYDIGFSE